MIDKPKYKCYLDDVLLADEPRGLDDLITEINRDFDIHGLLISTKSTLTFIGDGYEYLNCVYDSKSFCSEVKIKIEEQCSQEDQFEQIVDGVLRVSEFKKPDLSKDAITCPVEDNNYFARIKNNKAIEAYPNVGKSKNGIDFTPAVKDNVRMFVPTTGLWDGATRSGYRVFELFKFIISFISDDEIGFRSSLYDIGGKREGLFVTNGKHLSTGVLADYQNDNIGKLSFQDLIDECYKLDNIGFRIDTSGVKPVFVLEENIGFYKNTVSDILQNATGVSRKIKTDQLYSMVNFGSSKTNDDLRLSFPENIDFAGYKDETLHLTGQCNTERVLNIKGDWIRSSNVIQDILMCITQNPQDSYDDDFIFVECSKISPGNYEAIQYDIFNTGALPYYYNGDLTNDKVALRFFDNIPTAIAEYLGNGDGTFQASDAGNSVSLRIFNGNVGFGALQRFRDDYTPPNKDSGNNYGNGTTPGTPVSVLNSRYTVLRSGFYRFRAMEFVIPTYLTPNSILTGNTHTGTFRDAGSTPETVTNGSGAVATVVFWDAANNKLYVRNNTSSTFLGTTATGSSSGATLPVFISENSVGVNPGAHGRVKLVIERVDSSNVVIQTFTGDDLAWGLEGETMALNINVSTVANAGDYLRVRLAYNSDYLLRVDFVVYPVLFECDLTANGGGIFQESNIEDFKAEQFTLDYPISYSRFKNIKANPMDKLGFNIDGLTNITPWIENLKYHHSTKLAQINLLGKGQINKKECRPSIELEEDGGYSLREDSGLALRESQ